MKSLIIGRGFGQLYESQLAFLNANITTVDIDASKNPTYTSVIDIPIYEKFTTTNICVPNYLHEQYAQAIAKQSQIVFVEKPGVAGPDEWEKLVNDYPHTRFIMVKNNMFRNQIKWLRALAKEAKTVNLYWNNRDRVPSPGSWFTNKKQAYGGVSRDLIPHLLSWIPALFPMEWRQANMITRKAEQRWELSDLTGTDYGKVDKNGIYDVDDYAKMQFVLNGRMITAEANWRSITGPCDTLTKDKRCVELVFDDGTVLTYDFGLCPEYAYREMIKTCVDNLGNAEFWQAHYDIDMWIHTLLRKFDEPTIGN